MDQGLSTLVMGLSSHAPRLSDWPLQVAIDALVVLVILFGVGLVIIWTGFKDYRLGRLIRNTGTETVRSIAVGRTEIQGIARVPGPSLARPISEGECLYAHYRVDEEREGNDDDTTWATLAHDTWVMDFLVDDGTGTVRVEPEIDATFEISDDHTSWIEIPAGREEPPRIAVFLEQVAGVEPTTTRTRRYYEEVIPPGERVYVLGGAVPRQHGREHAAEELVISRDDASGQFVISDNTQGELTSELSRRAPMLIALGLALSAVSLYFILVQLGVS